MRVLLPIALLFGCQTPEEPVDYASEISALKMAVTAIEMRQDDTAEKLGDVEHICMTTRDAVQQLKCVAKPIPPKKRKRK